MVVLVVFAVFVVFVALAKGVAPAGPRSCCLVAVAAPPMVSPKPAGFRLCSVSSSPNKSISRDVCVSTRHARKQTNKETNKEAERQPTSRMTMSTGDVPPQCQE